MDFNDVPMATASNSLAGLLQQLFGSGAAAAAAPNGLGVSAPPPASPAAPPTAEDGTPLPPVRPPGLGIQPQVQASTPDAANPSTPAAQARQQPGGNLLVRLPNTQQPTMRDSTGAGAVKAIELAKGKSKWGAIAAGLAAGMQAQEAAQKEHGDALTKYLSTQFSQRKDIENMRRQGDLSDAQAQYYRWLASRGESNSRGGGGSGRTVTPEERAFRFSSAERQIRQNAQNRGLSGEALETEVARQLAIFGFRPGEGLPPVSGGAPAATARPPAPAAAATPAAPAASAPAAPAAPARPAAPAAAATDPLARARDALARGANRNAVIERLRQNGIDPAGL